MSTDRTRAIFDAYFVAADEHEPEPTAAELAAGILDGYGFTADDIREGIADGGSISVLEFRDDGEEA